MRNFKVEISYDGSGYHGYQFQINALSIQEVLEKAVNQILNTTVRINGCSRTDTGVHAEQYFFSVQHDSAVSCNGFLRGMNTLLPDDIAVLSCEEVDEEFHARFSSCGKKYVYRIWNGAVRNSFFNKRAMMYDKFLSTERLKECAEELVGTHDFTSFCPPSSSADNKIKTVYSINVERIGEMIEITFIGNGFLHNMVRIMVGTMIFYHEGKYTIDDIRSMFANPDRKKAGMTASADGLYLTKVYYDDEIKKDIGE